MNILSFFRTRPKPSAEQAKERLQILLAHERADLAGPDYLSKLKTELMQVIARYVPIDNDKIAVKLESAGTVSTLEVNIELPNGAPLRPLPGAQPAAAVDDRTEPKSELAPAEMAHAPS